MKKIKLRFAIFCCCLFLFGVNVSKLYAFDGYFAEYSGKASWNEERVRLDDFALYLLNIAPDYNGYIGFFVGEKDDYKKVAKRINRAKNYLVNHRKVPKDRIIIIYIGKDEKSSIILQPVRKDMPPPKFGDNQQLLH